MRWIPRLGSELGEGLGESADQGSPGPCARGCQRREGWPFARGSVFRRASGDAQHLSRAVPVIVRGDDPRAHSRRLVGQPVWRQALSVGVFGLVCFGSSATSVNAQAEKAPAAVAVETNAAGSDAPASPQRTLSGEPAVVTIAPERISNYRVHRTDITDALQSAIDSTSGPLRILMPAGLFFVNKGNIRINRDYVQIEGAGNGQTILDFMPIQSGAGTDESVLFVFQKPDRSTLSGAGIRDCSIVSEEVSLLGLKEGVDQYAAKVPSPHRKVAIRLVNTSLFHAENVSILRWWGGGGEDGGGSIGLQIQGRECARIQGLVIQADMPIRVEPNGDPTLRWIGIDHFHFSDLLLTASGGHPCVHILPNTPLTDTTFDGYQAWNRGGFGLKWDGAADAAVSIGLAIHNVRWEQPTAPGGYMIYISPGRTLYNLLLSNLNGGSQHPPRAGETAEPIVNGIYLRNVTNVALQNYFFVGTTMALKLDKTAAPGSSPGPAVGNVTLAGVDFPDVGTQVDLSGGVRMRGAYVRGAQTVRIDDGATPLH